MHEGDTTQTSEEAITSLLPTSTIQVSASQETIPDQPSDAPQEQQEAPQDQPPEPPSEWDQLRDHLRKEPQDSEAWLNLVGLAESSGDFERIKEAYEALLDAYPNTSSAQIAYITHVLESSHPNKFQHAVTLFNKYLKSSPFVELWKFYLSYVRRMNQGQNTRDTVRKAYEYALNHIGHDKESTEIWTDYIQFLKAGETATTWDESQKMDAIRKAYQRAVQTPMDGVKRLWEEYQEFENGLNKITAKKFLTDLQASHMQARTVLNQLHEHVNILFPPPPSSKSGRPAIWLPRPPTFSEAEKELVARWRKYIKFEENNPLEIEDKDKSTLHARIQSVYRKALVRMRFYPEFWYSAYGWTLGLSNDQSLPENKRKEKRDEALNILRAGLEANPASFVLNFAYAEALEEAKQYTEVHEAFKKFLDLLREGLEAMEAQQQAEANVNANASFDSTNGVQDVNGGAPGLPTTQSSSQQSQNSSFSSTTSDTTPSKKLHDRKTEYGIAYIVYMRFARRAEGLQSARTVFSKARRDKWTPWEVYEAAALMEYHCFKETDIAKRIFEKGLEYFNDDAEFALRYLGFLISINDDANARALFERVVNMFPPERARPIWDRWARYEYQFGTFQAAQNLEKRLIETFPNDSPIKRFAERHRYLGTDAIAVRDLGWVPKGSGSDSASSRSNTTGLARTETQQSFVTTAAYNQATGGVSATASSSSKRPPSPDHRRRGDNEYGPPSKRQRNPSPPREREGRDRWDHGRRRHSPPPHDRERDRDGHGRRVPEREEEPTVKLPPVLTWFIGQLPPPSAFDGPVFRTDDLMQVFRNAVIPSSSGIRPRSPPPPPRGGGRPPPDYSPYTGPGGGRRARY
ncbi:Suf-domain-containing protein [Panus rudis PR-1116 ss-1]|nr:Suf-domain-containing protein [Panus rudis PR-1116 ss-1]